MRKNYVNGKAFLKKNNKDLELEDSIHMALKESFEGQMTEDNIEVGTAVKPDLGGLLQLKLRITRLLLV